MTHPERHAYDLATRTVIDFDRETVYILPPTTSAQGANHSRRPVPRPRERRAHRSAKATRGSPSSDDDPSPEPEPPEPWDTPVGLLAAQVDGDANAIADGLVALGDDLRRYAQLLGDAQQDLYRQVESMRVRCRDAQAVRS